MHKDQDATPIKDALIKYKLKRVVSFDVPGHKQGKGSLALTEFFGSKCMAVDVNSMKPLDNLNHPVSVIKDAQELAAQAFGAAGAFFMVNGTTSAVTAMIMSAAKSGEKIIMPRNVHRSVINALILSGAVPVYVNPGIHEKLGIPLGMSIKDVKHAIQQNSDAKAVLVNNPTYYGICSNLKEIVNLAHSHNMLVLVDEAHGTHFYFGQELPCSAFAAKADMAAVSVHKTGGSLTQTSILLTGENVDYDYVRQIIGLTQTTSASYLLMASLDIARRNLALNGKEIFEKVSKMAQYAREEINGIGGYYAFGREIIDSDRIFDFDVTKLSIYTRDIGLAGIEVYDILRDKYDIQIEFGDIANILAIISIGDNQYAIERLVSALSEIKRLYARDKAGMLDYEYITPVTVTTPKDAFFAEKRSVPVADSKGAICGEFVMCYPPGIPILAPGERITKEALDYIAYAKEKGSLLTGTKDMDINYIQVLK